MARFEDKIVSPGRASDAIASLPVSALRLPSSVVASLHEVGIERVAAFCQQAARQPASPASGRTCCCGMIRR
jgi:hypothetical protein